MGINGGPVHDALEIRGRLSGAEVADEFAAWREQLPPACPASRRRCRPTCGDCFTACACAMRDWPARRC